MEDEMTVAIINSNRELVELIKGALETAGFTVVGEHLLKFKNGLNAFQYFLSTFRPKILLFDIAIPYEENWVYVHGLMDLKESKGRKFILTTINKSALEGIVGPTDTIEIIGKPRDLNEVVKKVTDYYEILKDGKKI